MAPSLISEVPIAFNTRGMSVIEYGMSSFVSSEFQPLTELVWLSVSPSKLITVTGNSSTSARTSESTALGMCVARILLQTPHQAKARLRSNDDLRCLDLPMAAVLGTEGFRRGRETWGSSGLGKRRPWRKSLFGQWYASSGISCGQPRQQIESADDGDDGLESAITRARRNALNQMITLNSISRSAILDGTRRIR